MTQSKGRSPFTPPSLDEIAGGKYKETEAGGSQPGQPDPANMTVAAEPEPRPDVKIELDWVAVSNWSLETLAIREDIAQIETTLKAMRGDDGRSRPDSPVYSGAVEMLEQALAGRRLELAAEIYRLHNLELPEEPQG